MPFRTRPAPPADFESKTLGRLRDAVAAIQGQREAEFSKEEHYQLVKTLCTHGKGTVAYAHLRDQCRVQVRANVALLARDAASSSSGAGAASTASFLAKASRLWSDHCYQFELIRSVYGYLDRTVVLQSPNLKSVRGMGLRLLRESLGAHAAVRMRVVEGVLSLVEDERRGNPGDRQLAKALTTMMVSLGTYSTDFEPRFLAATRAFYDAEARRLATSLEIADYLAHIEQRLNAEKDRVAAYLDEATRRPLLSTLEATLIAPHVNTLTTRGAAALVETHNKNAMRLMYGMWSRVDAQDQLKMAIKEAMRAQGARVLGSGKDEASQDAPPDTDRTIAQLLALHARCEELVRFCFSGDERFLYATRQAFEAFIGARDNHVAELLADHIHALLISSSSSTDSPGRRARLEADLGLFRYLKSKDYFQALHRSALSRRLISGRYSPDAEKFVIERLRAACGPQYSKQMEAMFNDMKMSRRHYEEFKAASRSGSSVALPQAASIEYSVRVLDGKSWPKSKPAVKPRLPGSLDDARAAFDEYFVKKNKGKKLVWDYSRTRCVVGACFPSGRFDLALTAFQACVLMAISRAQNQALRAAALPAKTGINDTQILRLTVDELVATGLLVRRQGGGRSAAGDLVALNQEYRSTVPVVQVKRILPKREKIVERKRLEEEVRRDRNVTLDAHIVRLLKRRKTMQYADLVREVLNLVKVPATPRHVKERVDDLVDKEYIERDASDPQVYNYLA